MAQDERAAMSEVDGLLTAYQRVRGGGNRGGATPPLGRPTAEGFSRPPRFVSPYRPMIRPPAIAKPWRVVPLRNWAS
jgi:hypothetical protein